jgi:hypothetical protein
MFPIIELILMGTEIILFGNRSFHGMSRQRSLRTRPFSVKLQRSRPHSRHAAFLVPSMPTAWRYEPAVSHKFDLLGLVGRIEHFKPKLPSFEGEKHRTEIGPLDTPAVDDHTWSAGVLVPIPLDPAPDHRLGDLRSGRIGDKMRGRQGTFDFLNELSQQREGSDSGLPRH